LMDGRLVVMSSSMFRPTDVLADADAQLCA
jgi:hypothetical protein